MPSAGDHSCWDWTNSSQHPQDRHQHITWLRIAGKMVSSAGKYWLLSIADYCRWLMMVDSRSRATAPVSIICSVPPMPVPKSLGRLQPPALTTETQPQPKKSIATPSLEHQEVNGQYWMLCSTGMGKAFLRGTSKSSVFGVQSFWTYRSIAHGFHDSGENDGKTRRIQILSKSNTKQQVIKWTSVRKQQVVDVFKLNPSWMTMTQGRAKHRP